MVSQPDHHHAYPAASIFSSSSSSAAAPLSSSRGPGTGPGPGASQSLVSRPAASSRSRRYNRSHTGVVGDSHAPLNEFPVFNHSGDVEIIVKAAGFDNRYLLHRHILTRCSGFFEASTSQEWSRATLNESPVAAEAPSRELARIAEDGGAGGDVDALLRLRDRQRERDWDRARDRDWDRNGERARGLPGSPTATGSSGGGGGARPRWRYELDRGPSDGDIPMLVQKPARAADVGKSIFGNGYATSTSYATPSSAVTTLSRSKTHHPSSSASAAGSSTNPFLRSVANLGLIQRDSIAAPPPLSQADQDLLRDYDNLFRIFYNYAPVLDGVNIADAYVQCKSLLTLADQYDALAVVGPRVDHHLLQFQSRLWRQIAKYPISYLRLGFLARSKVIFQEALIHVVGQWPVGERSLRAALPDAVLDIIEDKVDELEELISRVEGRLFRLGLTTSRGERVTPSTSYLDWLAMSLFRQWLADNTSPSSSSSSSDPNDRRAAHSDHSATMVSTSTSATPHLGAVGRAFRTLGSTNGSVYLGHDECKRFLKHSPELYNRDNLRRFEKRVDELKGMARDIVRPLMGSGLELELGSGRPVDGINYLTCTTVGDRDLPWPAME